MNTLRSISASALCAMLLSVSSQTLAAADPAPSLTIPKPGILSFDPLQGTKVTDIDGVSVCERQLIDTYGNKRRVVYLYPGPTGLQDACTPTGLNTPAIVALHYGNGTPERMANLTRIGRLVAEHGITVILPAAIAGRWDNDPDPRLDKRNRDDVRFIGDVIDQAISDFRLDATRIYMTGFSLGGFMTERFLCQEGQHRIAAAGWSSATLLDSLGGFKQYQTFDDHACDSYSPLPVMTFHGTRDSRVNYNGRTGYRSAPETAGYFAQRNGCGTPKRTALPDTQNDRTTVYYDDYAANSCSTALPVRFYTIVGGGHTWPGNEYQYGVTGVTTAEIDATLLLWNFFQGFHR